MPSRKRAAVVYLFLLLNAVYLCKVLRALYLAHFWTAPDREYRAFAGDEYCACARTARDVDKLRQTLGDPHPAELSENPAPARRVTIIAFGGSHQ